RRSSDLRLLFLLGQRFSSLFLLVIVLLEYQDHTSVCMSLLRQKARLMIDLLTLLSVHDGSLTMIHKLPSLDHLLTLAFSMMLHVLVVLKHLILNRQGG